MRNRVKRSLLVAFAIALSLPSFAQSDIADLLKFIEKAKPDVQKIATAYMDPLGKSLGRGFTGGWYNTAKPHKLGGFDITLSATMLPVSNSMKTYDVSKLGLTTLKIENGSSPITPTVLGKDVNGTQVYLESNGLKTSLTLPKGSNIPIVPVPMYNIGVGLPFHTEVAVRFIPNISFSGDGEVSLFGFAVKNEFKEFIPVFKMLPFNMSAFFGYTKYKLSWGLTDSEYAHSGFADQKLSSDSHSYTARVLVSKSIPVLTVYGGLGYNNSTTNFDVKGHYEIKSPTPLVNNYTTFDPLSMSYDTKGFVFNAGLRIKLAVFALFGDYTYAGTSMYTAGFGFTFR